MTTPDLTPEGRRNCEFCGTDNRGDQIACWKCGLWAGRTYQKISTTPAPTDSAALVERLAALRITGAHSTRNEDRGCGANNLIAQAIAALSSRAAALTPSHYWKDVCREKNGPEVCDEPCSRCAAAPTPAPVNMVTNLDTVEVGKPVVLRLWDNGGGHCYFEPYDPTPAPVGEPVAWIVEDLLKLATVPIFATNVKKHVEGIYSNPAEFKITPLYDRPPAADLTTPPEDVTTQIAQAREEARRETLEAAASIAQEKHDAAAKWAKHHIQNFDGQTDSLLIAVEIRALIAKDTK